MVAAAGAEEPAANLGHQVTMNSKDWCGEVDLPVQTSGTVRPLTTLVPGSCRLPSHTGLLLRGRMAQMPHCTHNAARIIVVPSTTRRPANGQWYWCSGPVVASAT